LTDALRTPEASSLLHQAAISQPLVTAIQVALVDLLASWNIKPTITIGHSSGKTRFPYAIYFHGS
jgi:acyl transferase domain-containing protein